MMNRPRISIVVPSYNQGQFLEETLDSILSQNYPDLELIVMDGGSSDNSVEIIKRFSHAIKFSVSEKDNGQTHAINKGFSHVTGEIFNWINSDDLLEPGALHSIAESFGSSPDKNLFLGRSRIFNATGTIGMSGRIIFDNTAMTLGYGQVNQPGMFYRTSAIRPFLPLNERLHMCMDLDLWMKFLLAYGQNSVMESDHCYAAFRQHEDSKTMSNGSSFRVEKDQLFYRLFEDSGSFVKGGTSLSLDEVRSYFELWKADEFMLNGDLRTASDALRKVTFRSLTGNGRRRYAGVYRRLLRYRMFGTK